MRITVLCCEYPPRTKFEIDQRRHEPIPALEVCMTNTSKTKKIDLQKETRELLEVDKTH